MTIARARVLPYGMGLELLKGVRRWIGVLAVGLVALPGVGQAEEAVGVVTTLAGQATRTASVSPIVPAPLRFKDDVFAADTIRTAERSLVRVLLERPLRRPDRVCGEDI